MALDWPDFNDLWDYNDPTGTETRFRALLPQAAQSSDRAYHLQLLTQIARTLSLQKKFDQAHALLDEAAEQMSGDEVVAVRVLLERGRTFNSSGRPAEAVPLFQEAAELGQRLGADFYAIDALHMLGIAAPPEERLEWNRKAIRYTEQSSQERAKTWLGSLYNNTGWSLFDEGRFEDALDLFRKAQAFRERQGKPAELRIARWCVARTLRALGQVEAALEIQRALEDEAQPDGFVDEEIAECLYTLGKVEAARPYFQKAYQALSQLDWVAEDTARLERLQSLGEILYQPKRKLLSPF